MSFKNFIKQNIISIPGTRTNKKLVVIESDDWGSQRIPSISIREKLIEKKIIGGNNRFNLIDSLEQTSDLNAIYEIFEKHHDYKGNSPIITANFLTDNPNFEAIKKSNFEQYFSESILETYKKNEPNSNTFNLITEGIEAGYLKPQYHGKEHLNVHQWMRLIQDDSSISREAFDHQVFCLDDPRISGKRQNLMAAFDFESESEREQVEDIFKIGYDNFEKIFSTKSLSFIAPCYIWHSNLEKTASDCGVQILQGIYNQYEPQLYKTKYKLKIHYTGQENQNKQKYVVRNCFMEVFENEFFDHVGDCINRMEIAFRWGKPAVIGMHRINFIGSLNEENRRNSLNKLDELFTKMLKKWPDIEFVSTDQLLNYI